MERHKPDLLLLDLEMPGMNGFQVLEYLRSYEAYRQLPVVIISAQEELDPYFAPMSIFEVTRAPRYSQQELLRWIRSMLE